MSSYTDVFFSELIDWEWQEPAWHFVFMNWEPTKAPILGRNISAVVEPAEDLVRQSPEVKKEPVKEEKEAELPRRANGPISSLLAGKFSDLEVIHGATRWNAHKLVVFSQSSVLESMAETPKNSITKLDLTDFEYPAVVRLMEYLYNSAYTSIDVEPEFFIPTHIRIFNLATSFKIPDLQLYAEEGFRNALNNHLTDVSVYFASVAHIYGTTTTQHPALRIAVIEAAVTEMKGLLNDAAAKRMLFKVMADVPDFQTDILRFLVEHPDRPVLVMSQQLCDNCGPAPEDQKYTLNRKCNGCGKDKSVEIY